MIQDTMVADLITSRQGPLKTWTEDLILNPFYDITNKTLSKTHFMTLQIRA